MKAYGHLKESSFPAHYRQEQVQVLQQAIARQSSVFVAGLSGMGKSNLARFFVSHSTLYDNRSAKVYIDCNSIGSTNELYAAIIQELVYLMNLENNHPVPEIDNVWALKQALKIQIRQAASTKRHLVFVLDRFEQFMTQTGDLYNYLRHLRDISGKRASYVLAARDCPPRASLGELGELFAADPLWVGPLRRRDAVDSIRRDAKRLDCIFDSDHEQKLYKLTGGHPGLLKHSCSAVATGLDLSTPRNQIIQELLENPSIRVECDELWSSLDGVERDELRHHVGSLDILSDAVGQSLNNKGILSQDNANGWQLFSPIFESSIPKPVDLALSEIEVQIEIRGNKVFVDNRECSLSKKEFSLFQLLFDNRGEIVTFDKIAFHVWPGNFQTQIETRQDSVSDGMINSLKSALERKLKKAHKARYIKTHRGRGYELL
jgi:hypothetical protein